ncbi:NnrU family protein [Pseudomarimonas salicorniae]|uniref:NnrU family protein n=1 Tax=Pseudomarimonas salicorniae TaxID=2933270 RepID=A0ABT0GI10_9GAMM|nr:NnrU family protein [Lysobacter sp. CAU 1642]MCK7594183.1 NnrU family protein [Lysobacter sp. CAU 1642]
MALLVAGLVIFLGLHLLPLLAPGLRASAAARLGEGPWKGAFALLSLVGFALLVVGYGEARQGAVTLLYAPPVWTRHLAYLLTLVAFILLLAPYTGRNHFRARFGHPMVLGAKSWALAHLLANGFLHDLLLFGGFLAWGVLSFILLRRRDRALGRAPVTPNWGSTLVTILAGGVAWFAFAKWLHPMWIGVAIFPG